VFYIYKKISGSEGKKYRVLKGSFEIDFNYRVLKGNGLKISGSEGKRYRVLKGSLSGSEGKTIGF